MNRDISYNSKNTTFKEQIRTRLRHALTLRGTQPIPQVDYQVPLFPPIENIHREFVQNFRKQGGKIRLCEEDQLLNDLLLFIKNQSFNSILNTCKFLIKPFKEQSIPYSTSINYNNNPDLAIVCAHFFIARSGGILFSQQYTHYPDVRSLAKDILIIGFTSQVLPDLRHALEAIHQQENAEKVLFEILNPTPQITQHDDTNGDFEIEENIVNPQLSLLLIKK